MTDRLDEIRSRAEAATPGPWTIEPLDRKYYGTEILDGNARTLFTIWRDNESGPSTREIERAGLDGDFEWSHMESADDYADATFTAHAREDIPYLLAENERLRAERNVYARHSVTCNSIAWRIAEIVGDVPDGVDQVLDDPFGRLDRLEAELERLRAALTDVLPWAQEAFDDTGHNMKYNAAVAFAVRLQEYAALTEGGES